MQAVKVILFGLLLSLSALNESDCNSSQDLETGQTYVFNYVFNPEFPNKYQDENNRTWKMTNSNVIKLNCSLEMDDNCDQSRLELKDIYDNIFPLCGYKTIVYKRINLIEIKFISQINSKGRFLCEIKIVNNNCNCGWKKVTRIVGGKETGVNEYPMMCGLVDIKEKMIYCGCTIISNRYVLTAAHCVHERNITQIGVVVGEHDTSTGKDTNATRLFRLVKLIIHPWYKRDKTAYDIAVCEIFGSIEYSDKVGPVCLPFQKKQKSFDDNIVTALGWGLLEFAGPKSTTLQKVDLNVISLKKCNYFYDNVSNNNMCTYTPGKDTCQMDSGGPLLWENPKTHRIVQIGIIVAGHGCASGWPAVSIRIGPHLDWIIRITFDTQYCHVE